MCRDLVSFIGVKVSIRHILKNWLSNILFFFHSIVRCFLVARLLLALPESVIRVLAKSPAIFQVYNVLSTVFFLNITVLAQTSLIL